MVVSIYRKGGERKENKKRSLTRRWVAEELDVSGCKHRKRQALGELLIGPEGQRGKCVTQFLKIRCIQYYI